MKRFAILAVGALALLGGTAATADAAAGANGGKTAATCVSHFSSLRTMTGRGGRAGPCGAREPKLKHGGNAKALGKAKGKKEHAFKRKIHVHVHVLVNPTPNPALPFDDVGRVSKETLQQQVDALNLAYGGFAGGADTGFRFQLKKIDYTENAAWYRAEVGSPEELAFKTALRTGKPDDLNLYVKGGIESPNSVAGWAYMPDVLSAPAELTYLDGVAVDHRTLPGGPIPGFDLGHTATHEVGHWLGLFHTFHPGEAPGLSGCDGEGDFVDDTPAHDLFTFPGEVGPCGEGSDTCPQAGVDPIHNFMNYSFDPCYREFTAGQAERMQSQFLFWRDKGKYPRA